jgi:RNA polymerase sigma-70 factor, ECF subfamily
VLDVETNVEPARSAESDPFGGLLDEELAVLAKTNALALASLYRRHVSRIAQYVARRVSPGHEAEDITAQVFLAMVRGLPKWSPTRAPFIAWLYRLAINAIISWTRRQRFRRWVGLGSDPTAREGKPMDDAEELHVALRQTPEPYQRTLILHYIEQLPVTTVAQVLGIAEGTVKSRLTRGRTLLKQILESKSRRVP